MERFETVADVATATGGDALACWAAQRLESGGAAYGYGDAVGVVAPDLFRRDRLVVRGPAHHAVELTRQIRTALPVTFRLLGTAELVHTIVREIPELPEAHEFGWMETRTLAASSRRAVWLTAEELTEAETLARRVHPETWAVPGESPDHRWAGARHQDGQLVALAADAWSGGGVGFISGVLTDGLVRGMGYAQDTTAFVTHDLVRRYGRAALMVDLDNHVAVRLYRRLGFAGETVAAARLFR
ncbi:GNAT family N-acetyltransferase [Phytoactinopolyspora alkaliphila]|uniref:GNAT family N-acetyltransferase n=1 Tax=Phytoactinopolyspora alkaliphila TaxID=1783498 RepID=A0A6N9YQD8_9ACTN|nr:GNAT family N-acetyltransferase [Phytoactinopolyspora alkaliphila]NED97261.1 GNAT family N-acetyltransferase [Phytoactinopolyspora alkaliphila]